MGTNSKNLGFENAYEKSIKRLLAAVESFSGCEILKQDRHKRVMAVRQAFCLIAWEQEVWGYDEIGKAIGRDRTTVVHNVKTAKNRLCTDPYFKGLYRDITHHLGQTNSHFKTMEGIVKVNKVTAQAIETLSVEAWLMGERIAGESEGEIQEALSKLMDKRVLDRGRYTFLYMPETNPRILEQDYKNRIRHETKR